MAIFDWLRNWQREQQRKAAEREAAAKREAERRIQAAMEAARLEAERKAREERDKPQTETPDVPIVIIGGPRGGGGAPAYSITLAADDATVSGAQGTTVDINLTVTRNNGFTGTVSLAVTGLPSGVSGAFSDSSLSSGETTSTLTLTIDIAAGLVTADVFVITASASGVSDSTVNGTVTVTASGSMGDPVAGEVAGDDFFNYANDAALQAAFRQTDPTTDSDTGQFYNDCVRKAQAELTTNPVSGSEKWYQAKILDASGEPNIRKNNITPTTKVGVFFEHAFAAGFRTKGSDGTIGAYKLFFITYSNANGRTSYEYTNGTVGSGGTFNFGGGMTDSGSGNYTMTTADSWDPSAPYTLWNGSTGIWDVPQTIRNLVEGETVTLSNGAKYQISRLYTWLDGGSVPTQPTYQTYVRIDGGNGPSYSGVVLGANYNAPTGTRTAAPTGIYFRRWKWYDRNTVANPCSFNAPPTIDVSKTSLSVARSGSTTIDVTIDRGSYTGTVTLLGKPSSSSGTDSNVTFAQTFASGETTKTITVNCSSGGTPGTYGGWAIEFVELKTRLTMPLTIT